MSVENYKIYTLTEHGSELVRYVGLTKYTLEHRLRSHFDDKRNSHRAHWLKSLKEKPDMQLIEDGLTLEQANEKEIFYIKLFKSVGAKLVNNTFGGDGTRGYKPSQETRALWSKIRTGRKQSEESKAKRSLSLKNRYFSPEHRKKISAALKGRPLPEALKEKMRGRIVSEATRMKLSLINKGKPSQWKGKKHTDEARKKIKAKRALQVITQETRGKMSAWHKAHPENHIHLKHYQYKRILA